jgi:hypothetical protein
MLLVSQHRLFGRRKVAQNVWGTNVARISMHVT